MRGAIDQLTSIRHAEPAEWIALAGTERISPGRFVHAELAAVA